MDAGEYCSKCTSSTSCSACLPGYVFHQNKCLDKCPTGFYNNSGTCSGKNCYQEDLILFKLVYQKHRVVQSASQQRDLVLRVHQLGITLARRALPHAQTEVMLIVI